MTLSGRFALEPSAREKIYAPAQFAEISQLTSIVGAPVTGREVTADPHLLADVELLFGGWGSPRLTAEVLDAAPKLKAVFYGAGSIRGIVTDAFWERGITVTSAYAANAVPVAEYTLAQIILCLKRSWTHATAVRDARGYKRMTVPGTVGSTVGLVSLGMIGRMVREHLRILDVKVIAYDPFVAPEEAAKLGVRMVSLDEVFRTADVVSLHTPWTPQTEKMIGRHHFELLKSGASFINTARGAVINEPEMLAVLAERPDLFAAIDVPWPEPPPPESPYYTLPNVFLTPHIAGSMDNECNRMGQYMVEELKRFLAGEPLLYSLTREKAEIMA